MATARMPRVTAPAKASAHASAAIGMARRPMIVMAQAISSTARTGTASNCASTPAQKLPLTSRAALLATASSASSALMRTTSPITRPMPKVPDTAMRVEVSIPVRSARSAR